MKHFKCIQRRVIFAYTLSFLISLEIIEGYQRRYYSDPRGGYNPQSEWDWWQILLLAAGIILGTFVIWFVGQSFCTTEGQEMC